MKDRFTTVATNSKGVVSGEPKAAFNRIDYRLIAVNDQYGEARRSALLGELVVHTFGSGIYFR
jgi:hypothetical protein